MKQRMPFFFFLALFLLLCACGAAPEIPCLHSPDTDWENISQITLRSDGYYGRRAEEPLVISDAKDIQRLTHSLLNIRAYRTVKPEKALEGMNGIWADFGNGIVLGMYADENYGSFSSDPDTFYRLPAALCRQVRQFLVENQ